MVEYAPKRKYRYGETMYVAEILKTFYPGAITISPVRLGKLPEPPEGQQWTESERRMLMTSQRWGDAVAIEGGVLHLIEAKLLPSRYPEGESKLRFYRTLVPNTESLKQYSWATFVAELWTPTDDILTRSLCRQDSIELHVFEPKWFSIWLSIYPKTAWRQPAIE